MRFAPLQNFNLSDGWRTFWSVAILLAFLVAIALVFNAAQRDESWHWDNETLKDRRRNFANLLGITKSSLLLVTGCLHGDLFGHASVVQALRRMPEGVRIKVFYESEKLDAGCAAFVAELVRREAEFIRIEPSKISHGAVFDDLHVKIEQFGVEHDAKEKHVDYYAFDPDRALRARLDIEAVPTLRVDAEPEMELLRVANG
ncbi:MAG: hypothetical protein WAU68_08365 [Vitreimonas sp.]